MLIDWFTVVAQIVNFLILVWLLKRFLYRPILNAMDAREKRIADRLKAAEVAIEDAKAEREDLQRQTQDLEQKRASLLKEAVAHANTEHQKLLETVRKEAEAARGQWEQSLRSQRTALQHELTMRTQQEVFAISRKALADLATQQIEGRVVEIFLNKLRGLNGDAKDRLMASLKTGGLHAVVRTAFQLPNTAQVELKQVVNDLSGTEVPIRFATAPDLIGGIELEAGGEKVNWSISDYLNSLEKTVTELIDGQEADDADRT